MRCVSDPIHGLDTGWTLQELLDFLASRGPTEAPSDESLWVGRTWSMRQLEESLDGIRILGVRHPTAAHRLAWRLLETMPHVREIADEGRLEHFCMAVARTLMELAFQAGHSVEQSERFLLGILASHERPCLLGLSRILCEISAAASDRERIASAACDLLASALPTRRPVLLALAESLLEPAPV